MTTRALTPNIQRTCGCKTAPAIMIGPPVLKAGRQCGSFPYPSIAEPFRRIDTAIVIIIKESTPAFLALRMTNRSMAKPTQPVVRTAAKKARNTGK